MNLSELVKRLIIIKLLLLFSSCFLFADNNGYEDDIDYSVPQKIFIHTDKNVYNVNEYIWLSVSVLNSVTHIPDNNSSNVYVDVVSIDGAKVFSKILQIENGFSDGSIFLPDTLPDGNYMISAYTEWIRAISDSHVFTKNVYINNANEKDFISRERLNFNISVNEDIFEKRNTVNYKFFSEGGSFVAGVKNRVLLRLWNELGEGIEFSGKVFGQNQELFAEIDIIYKGYGVFTIIPEFGQNYYVGISYYDREKIVPLFNADKKGVSVLIEKSNDSGVNLLINTFDPDTDTDSSESYVLTVKQGFVEVYESEIYGGVVYNLNNSELPSGVSNFIVKNERGEVVAERLFFSFHDDVIDIKLIAEEISVDDSRINIPLIFSKDKDVAVNGVFSFSMHYLTNCEYIDYVIPRENIVEHLFLNSDIIDADFLEEAKGISLNEYEDIINHILIGKEWKWGIDEQLIVEKSKNQGLYFPEMLTLRGEVINPDENELIKQDFLVTITDEKKVEKKVVANDGVFEFTDLYYEGSFYISVRLDETKRIREPIKANVTLNSFAPLDYKINTYTKEHQILELGSNWKNPNPWYRRIFRSPDAELSTKRPDSYLNPSQTIYLEDVPLTYHSSMMQVLRSYVRNLNVNEYGIIVLRDTGRRNAMIDPLFLVDGLTVDKGYFLSLNISTIERIDVFRGASASVFGSRGAHGAIAAYTQRSHFLSATVVDFELDGYHIKDEFDIESAFDNQGMVIPCKTLFFIPNLQIIDQKNVSVKIPASLPKGDYMIIIQGLDYAGYPGFKKLGFTIK